jgi:hypothetical protein
MERWPINARMHVMVAIAIGLDCILNGIVVESIATSLDCVLMSILLNRLRSAQMVYQSMLTVFSTLDSMVGLTVGSTWCAGLSTSAKCLTAQTRGFYSYQSRGFNGLLLNKLVILQTLSWLSAKSA